MVEAIRPDIFKDVSPQALPDAATVFEAPQIVAPVVACHPRVEGAINVYDSDGHRVRLSKKGGGLTDEIPVAELDLKTAEEIAALRGFKPGEDVTTKMPYTNRLI